MSCINTTEEEEDSTVNEDDCNPEIAEACPPSVKDAIGMNQFGYKKPCFP